MSKYISFRRRWNCFLALSLFCLRAPVFSQEPEFISYLRDTNLNWVVTCSPDGKNIYAGGLYTLAAFRLNLAGELETLQVLNNDYKGVKDLRSIVNLAVSPDGRFLYAVSAGNRSLLIFSRNTTSGRLSFKLALQDSVFGYWNNAFAGEEDFHSLFFSPEGKQLYWQGRRFNGVVSAIAVFQRNLNTGQLTKVQVLREHDPAFGNLGVPSYLTIAPDGKHLYGAGSGRHTKVTIFARHANTGILQLQSSFETYANSTIWDFGSVAISKSGEAIYASHYSAFQCFVLRRDRETGELSSLQKLNHLRPRYILVSPRDGHVYLRHSGSFAIYAKEDTSERLFLKDSFPTNYDAALPAGACISPSGKAIYMTGEVGLTVLQIDSATAGLKVLQHWDNFNIGGLDRLQYPPSVAVSRNGKFVYVAASHDDSGISVFKRDPANGQVTFSGFYAIDYYRRGRMFASPEGRHLYLVQIGDRDKKLQIFSTNETDGAVRLVQTLQDTLINEEWLGITASITFSPDGRHIYFNDVSRVLVYERNLATGALAPVQTITGRDFQIGKIYGLALSPDGELLYSSGSIVSNVLLDDLLLSTFARDTTTGRLTFVRKQSFYGIYPSAGLVVSPDHRHLYVTLYNNGEDETGVLIGFARNPISGQFSFVSVPDYTEYTQEGGEVLAISDDGKDVYFSEGSILAMLERNPETGVLTERKLFFQKKNNVYGMSGYTGFALSPDNRQLYASAFNALGTFTTGRASVSAVQERETSGAIPRALVLEQNYPNPMHAALEISPTTIRYEIPEAARVELAIYNLQGQLVRTLVDEIKTPGKYSASWNGRNAQGGRVPSGIYFYRVHAGNMLVTRRLLLL